MRAFRVVAASGFLVLGVLVFMLFLQRTAPRQATQPAVVPIPIPSAEPQPSPSVAPAPPAPEPPEPPEPEPVQPAQGDFAEFSSVASLRHPEAEPNTDRWYKEFGYLRPGDDLIATGEWVNKEELWNALAPVVKDEATRLGRQYHRPMWDFTNPVPSVLNSTWSNEDTKGRGEVLEFVVSYERAGQARVRHWPVVIRTLPGRRGEVVAQMPPVDVAERDFTAYVAASDVIYDRIWTWLWTDAPAAPRN